MQTAAREEYLKAQRLGLKEKRELEAQGFSPFPPVLTEFFPEAAHTNPSDVFLAEIPAERVIGTVSRGRMSAFSASFMPLPEPESEFAAKWIALCEAHLSDTGIRDPIECIEYLGDFYVSEGNKRASVLKAFGAVKIPARVRRVLPADTEDPAAAAYMEALGFYRETGLYDIRFRKPGEYNRLLAAFGRMPEDGWTEEEKRRLASTYAHFKEAFAAEDGPKNGLRPEDALPLLLKVCPYEKLSEMSPSEMRKTLSALHWDVKAAAEPDRINVQTSPGEDEKRGVISKLILGAPKHLDVAFINERVPASSTWTKGHAEGAVYLQKALGGQVSVRTYYYADSPEEAEALLDEAAKDGAELIFTTTPPLLDSTLKAALKHPKIRFYNCSACQPLSSVKSYYCRTYEGKFITGLIAGALADNDLVGYIGSYPILGVPASINAFALGARMTNPRARIMLEWTSLEQDCIGRLREKGVKVISNRDVPIPDVNYLKQGYYGTFLADETGELRPVASPCWVWGRLYENIVRSILAGGTDKKEQAVNYWWGMDSGVIDVALTELVPEGVRALAEEFIQRLKSGGFDIFGRRTEAQDGSLISDGITPLTSLEILKMDRLVSGIEGHIPEYGELLPIARGLVRELGLHRESIPPRED